MFHLFLLVLLLFDSQSQVGCLNEEGLALLSFKQAISEDPQGSLNNWNDSDENPCSWNGIICKDQKVVSFSIPNKNISGLLPSALGSLLSLRHVNLRSNRLSGNLPIQLLQVLGLQSLVLSENFLNGPLPSVVGKLNYLQILDLSHNFFNGSLPSLVLQCKKLRVLDLSGNNFTGLLPDGFGTKLASLESLNLSYNKFNGSIPSDIGNLSSLQGTIDLSHNQFSGSIPASLGNLPENVYIDVTYNNLSGPIPLNGALMNRGPTAFLGNPGLCGSPLNTPCSSDLASSSYPYMPTNNSTQSGKNKGRGLTKKAVILIIASDIVGICLAGLLFSYCYTKACSPIDSKSENECGFDKGTRKGGKDCLCFAKDDSETQSENVDQCELVPFDLQVSFNLDQLLKASAFVLGKSGIGIMYKVVLEGGINVAVRRLGEGGSQRLKEFQTEVEAIGKLSHPNIVTLRAYYWSSDEKLLIYEYAPNGSLSTALHGNPGMASFTPLPWSTRLSIMKGIAKGLVYLHEFSPKKYIHGDIKPSNILLGRNMEPKISDFGLGRLASIAGLASPTLQSNRMTVTSDSGSVSTSGNSVSYYQAPEAMKAVKPSQKWDVYSYGVILMEMITGKTPLVQVGSSEIDLVQWIQSCIDEHKPFVDVLDPSLCQMVDSKEDEIVAVLKIALSCVHGSPEKRPSMRHVLEALDRFSKNSD
ncbi:hypothetical protein V2J09_012802 [Rumex salicifolius]